MSPLVSFGAIPGAWAPPMGGDGAVDDRFVTQGDGTLPKAFKQVRARSSCAPRDTRGDIPTGKGAVHQPRALPCPGRWQPFAAAR
jgi:hypothetical protein